MTTRLRVGRAVGKTETEASSALFHGVKRRSGSPHPPPLVSDGWGGHREALVEVYGQVPAYRGRGRPPSRKWPQAGWQYLQMVKQREDGRVVGVQSRPIFGETTSLAHHTAYVERTNLTSRQMTGRLVRKTLGFSKNLAMLRAACTWEDSVYNLTRHVKTLRLAVNDGCRRWQYRSPAMAAGLTDHIWTIQELLFLVPVPINT